MDFFQDFIKKESASGIMLLLATALALAMSNTDLSGFYHWFTHLKIAIHIDQFSLDKSLYHWVNDGLMAIFFLVIGLEVKREIFTGQLSSWNQAALPVFAAIGGIVVPACIYLIINIQSDSIALKGWAIPTATDIAFAIGILSLLGRRVPISLKIFLMALAIIDDIIAIVVIAIFYTSNLSWLSIGVATACIVVLTILNRCKVSHKSIYLFIGGILWLSVLKSGVHATLAGVALAFTIPMSITRDDKQQCMVTDIEHRLHTWVAMLIMPCFAFVNAGVDFRGLTLQDMLQPVPIGILLGLLLGKQIGVFGVAWFMIRTRLVQMPEGVNWGQIYGISILTGIGFTMSLFITSLAFPVDNLFQFTDKLAILLASVVSAIAGLIVLFFSHKERISAT